MGLLSFLKRENERLRSPLKAQAYDTTTASKPPVKGEPRTADRQEKCAPEKKGEWWRGRALTRTGTYPVSGAKPPVRKHVPRRIDTNEPSSPVTGFPAFQSVEPEPTSPLPLPPTLHDGPITAPNSRPGSSHQRAPIWYRRDPRSPPVSFRKPFAETPPEPSNEEFHFEKNAAVEPPPRPPSSYGHSRTASMTSRSARLASVDILDAQWEIRPADFHSRVAAAGVRNYGEDVADRNIALNGGSNPASTRPSMSSRGPSYHGSAPGDRDTPFHLRRLPPSPEVSRSIASSHSRYPSEPDGDWSVPARAYTSPRAIPPLSVRPDGLALRDPGMAPGLKPKSASTHERHNSDHLARGRRSIHGCVAYAAPSFDIPGARPRPASLSRAYSSDRSQRSRTNSFQRGDDSELRALQEELSTIGVARTRSHRRVGSETLDSEASVSRPPSRGSSSIPLPIRLRPVSDYDHRPMSSGSDQNSYPRHDDVNWSNGPRLGHIDIESTADPHDSAAPSPHIRRGDRIDSLYSYDRTRSLPMKGRYPLDEIVEAVPIRGSSLRHSSMTSTTPSVGSSNMFQRPHSRHTAQTSIDISYSSPAFPSSSSSGNGVYEKDEGGGIGEGAEGGEGAAGTSPVTVIRSPSFNMDDCISDDEVDGTKLSRSPDDEGLLFDDSGYGFQGSQLPGLFDAIPEFPLEETSFAQPFSPARALQHVRESRHSARSPSVGSTQSEDYYSVASRTRPSSRAVPEDSEEDSKSGEYEDVLVRARSLREKKDGVSPGDIKRAVQMRKESRSRLREEKEESNSASAAENSSS